RAPRARTAAPAGRRRGTASAPGRRERTNLRSATGYPPPSRSTPRGTLRHATTRGRSGRGRGGEPGERRSPPSGEHLQVLPGEEIVLLLRGAAGACGRRRVDRGSRREDGRVGGGGGRRQDAARTRGDPPGSPRFGKGGFRGAGYLGGFRRGPPPDPEEDAEKHDMKQH